MLAHDIPEIPFYKIIIVIAEFGSVIYLIVTYWLLISMACDCKIKNKTSDAVIDALMDLFSKFGIPNEVISDNMPFNNLRFSEFA